MCGCVCVCVGVCVSSQLNEALCDNPSDKLDYSLRQEQDQILRVSERVLAAMARCVTHTHTHTHTIQRARTWLLSMASTSMHRAWHGRMRVAWCASVFVACVVCVITCALQVPTQGYVCGLMQRNNMSCVCVCVGMQVLPTQGYVRGLMQCAAAEQGSALPHVARHTAAVQAAA